MCRIGITGGNSMKITRVPYQDMEINLFELNLKESIIDVLRLVIDDPSLDNGGDYTERCKQCHVDSYEDCRGCFAYDYWFTAFAIKSGCKMIIVRNNVCSSRIENFDDVDSQTWVAEDIYLALEGGRKEIQLG